MKLISNFFIFYFSSSAPVEQPSESDNEPPKLWRPKFARLAAGVVTKCLVQMVVCRLVM